MKIRAKKLLAGWIALQCVAWLTTAAIAPQLHQGFANHHHVFSFDHNRIEDAEHGSIGDCQEEANLAAPRSLAVYYSGNRDSRSECVLSNLVVHATFKVAHWTPTIELLERGWVGSIRIDEPGITEVLNFAPKTSPPVAG
jgi:hypothetical protein